MILIKATIKYAGYNPDDLSPKSHKRICRSCDICGRVRWISKSKYNSICLLCSSKSGKNSQNYKRGKIIKICKYCKKEF